MRRTPGPRPGLALALSLSLAATTGVLATAGAATAAPAPAGVVLTPGTTYSTSTNTHAQSIAIPVPDGLTPHQVTGTLAFDNDASGTVQILAHHEVVATVKKQASTASAPVTVPVSARDVSNGAISLQLRYLAGTLTDPKLSCVQSNNGNVQLTSVRVDASGTAKAPTTLASFFSAGVTAVSIVVPSAGSADLQAAGLSAEAAVVHRYSSADVTVTTPDDAGRAAAVTPAEGRIVKLVGGSGEVRTSISATGGVPTLTLTGDPSRLADAAAALGSANLVLGDTTTASRLGQSGVPSGRTSETFADLGQSAPALQGLGESDFAVTVKQSDFGASVRQMKVHLVGRYAQLPSSLQAVLTYSWNGQLIGSQVLSNANTAIDQTLTVPATQLTFSNSLQVQLNAVPSGSGGSGGSAGSSGSSGSAFGCGGPVDYLPIKVTFDGLASTVTAVRGQSTDPGFARFPQTLGNVLTTAFGAQATADDLTNAAGVLQALQQLNSDQLSINLVSPSRLVGTSASGLLVGATAQQVDDLQAPLRMDEFRSIDQQNVHFGVGVTDPYAAFQAFHQNGRDLLVLSSWSPQGADQTTGRALQSALVDDLVTAKGDWYGLSGDLIVRQSTDGENVSLDSNSVVPQAAKVHHLATYVWWIIAFVGLLVLLLLAQWISGRRLRKRARQLVDAQEEADAQASAQAVAEAQAEADRAVPGPTTDPGHVSDPRHHHRAADQDEPGDGSHH
ncbi:hypothetical protein P5P86_12825 [Nocardioides sp. BP30]|uniref:hypothetical protein n=1 Tax=Nocardioides sp. BP30 TaxID=3036374 RepID=UPI00246971D0|nr:hypothetical protein [Nocardioides sp. BP30]WGL50847.1 hypothetical protein P5P86_12825 [Nocardioides sp. BP30]